MSPDKIFPLVIITISFSAGVVYAIYGDVRHATYWFAATILNIAVTF